MAKIRKARDYYRTGRSDVEKTKEKGKLSNFSKTKPKVINLSSRDLSDQEIKLLEHGLKFTPTPISDNVDLITDTDEFCRKLRLREFFGNTNYEDGSLVRNKKGTNPQPNRDKHLEEYINCLKQTANTNIVDSHVKSNLPKSQQKTIKKLQNDESIIIKEADKGGGIVIMDKDHYKDMVLNQLEDGLFYQKLNGNRDKSTMSKIRKLIKEYSDNLTDKEKDYLKNFEVKTSNFYGLPKIHKSKEIQDHVENCDSMYIKINRPTDLKIRPIIAGPSCSTQRLSNLLDILLKPLCIKVPSFVRDDMDFLNYIPDRVPLDTILVSFDVISLYTNIPHELGLKAVQYWLEKYLDEIPERFSNDFIIKGLKLILENNYFQFNDTYYLQIKGTAMGTKVAPTYATLVMGYIEKQLYEKIPSEFDENFRVYIEENWKRYLDDCFIFWTKSEVELNKFHSMLNALNESIQFTYDSSSSKLPFLDINIIKEEEQIITDLYCKPTDTHQYLDFRSCHPSHTKRNIPFNLARRICTIVINLELRDKRLQELKNYLKRQNYPVRLIENGIKNALKIPIAELRKTVSREDKKDKQKQYIFQSTRVMKISVCILLCLMLAFVGTARDAALLLHSASVMDKDVDLPRNVVLIDVFTDIANSERLAGFGHDEMDDYLNSMFLNYTKNIF
ncbi:uncharacterized protein [Mytilus edulis]|uniref:uncharacterized protein n=1 Tax=Mytilus edulis TaxID=6550 RepID=UPI0039EFD3FE